MKKYLLLRNNSQSGPYTFDELSRLALEEKDLVWIENESSAWAFPHETSELRDLVKEEEKPSSKVFISHPQGRRSFYSRSQDNTRSKYDEAEIKTNLNQPLPELKQRLEDFNQKKSIWQKAGLSSLTEVIKLAAVFAGLVFGAFMMKKTVDGTDKTIGDTTLPASVFVEAPSPANIDNALLTEEKFIAEPTPAEIKKPKPKDIKKQVQLKSNVYEVGLLGGINNLELKVNNTSPHAVDKVTIAVEYMKRNGDVIQTDNYEVFAIKPNSTKHLSIPDSKRGVKVKYKIVDVKSKDYSKAIKEV